MRLLTTKKERLIRMKPPRTVSKLEKILFPIIGMLFTCFIVPSGLPLLGIFFGNLLKSTVTKRLADTAKGPMIDIVTILIGLTVGASTQATTFLTEKSLLIFVLEDCRFIYYCNVWRCNVCEDRKQLPEEGNKMNPLIGNMSVSAVPDSARVSQVIEPNMINHSLQVSRSECCRCYWQRSKPGYFQFFCIHSISQVRKKPLIRGFFYFYTFFPCLTTFFNHLIICSLLELPVAPDVEKLQLSAKLLNVCPKIQ
ncbi:MAG: sodium ion-translocating decarboxylase subunit beta [Bacteroidales bacterium]